MRGAMRTGQHRFLGQLFPRLCLVTTLHHKNASGDIRALELNVGMEIFQIGVLHPIIGVDERNICTAHTFNAVVPRV